MLVSCVVVSGNRTIVPIAVLVFLALAIVVNWPVLQGKVPLPAGIVTFFPAWEHLHQGPPAWPHVSELGDLVTAFYPWRLFTARTLKAGEWPLWNPMVIAGAPFLGATQSALFYPLTYLYWLFDTPVAWTLNILLRIVIAGCFTVLFARGIGASRTGAFAAGIIYVLCGPFTVWQGQALGDAWVWLPAVLCAVDRLYFRPNIPRAILLAASFALPVVAGHPESALHIAVIGLALACYRVICFHQESKAFFVALFALAAVLGAALAMVQILPTLEWLTQIDAGLEGLQPARSAYEALAFFCRDIRTNTNSAGIHIPEAAAYAGMIPLLMAGFGLAGKHRRIAIFWLLAILAGLQIVYGFGPVNWLLQSVPVVRALKNNRILFIVDFGIAILAGLGVTTLQTEAALTKERSRMIRQWTILLLGFVLVAFGIVLLRSLTVHRIPDWDQTPRSAFMLLAAGGTVIGLRLAGFFKSSTFAGLALAVLLLDLVSFSLRTVPFARSSDIFPTAPVFDFLSTQSQPFRVAAVDSVYIPNFDMAYGLSSITGYEIWPRRTARLMDSLRTPGVVGMVATSKAIAESQDRILDLLNVRYLITSAQPNLPDRFVNVFSERSINVFENTRSLPRAFAVSANCVDAVESDEHQLARVRDPLFDPLRRVILDSTAEDSSFGELPCVENGSAVDHFSMDSPNRASMDVELNHASIVVWSEMSYPGWRVLVDQQPKDLLRADYNLMAVAVPAGSHHIEFVFDPFTLRVGGWISALAAGVSLLSLGYWRFWSAV